MILQAKMLIFGILLRSAVGRLSWSSERGKQFSTENINRLGKACVLHGLGARFHTPLHSCAFSDERSTGKDTRKSADAQKVKIASKMFPQPIVFVLFSPDFFCLIFPCRTVQKRNFSAIISGTWADFPQRLRQTLPIRGMDPLSTISAMKNGATALRNRKSIFTKKNV